MMAPRPRRICSLGRIDFRAKVTRNFFLFQNQEEVERSRWKSRKKNREQRKNVEGLLRKNFLSPSLFLSLSYTPTCTHTHTLPLSLSHTQSSPSLSHTYTLPLSPSPSLILALAHAHPPTTKCVHARTHSLSFRSGTQDGNTNRLWLETKIINK